MGREISRVFRCHSVSETVLAEDTETTTLQSFRVEIPGSILDLILRFVKGQSSSFCCIYSLVPSSLRPSSVIGR